MDVTFEALSVLIFLIPGFIVTLVKDTLVFSLKRDKAIILVESLIWSFVIYSVLSLFSPVKPISLVETQEAGKATYGVAYNGVFGAILAASLILALAYAYAINNDVLTRVLRKLRITTHSSRGNVWLDVFAEQKRYVIVHLTDGRRVSGWVTNYSNTPKEPTIYLYDFRWIDEATQQLISNDSHGILFFKKDSIAFIEFTSFDAKKAIEEEQKKSST